MTSVGNGGLDVKNFVEGFPSLAGIEGGVRKLQDLVLELAVTGRLLVQRSSEVSPVPRIEQERAELLTQRKMFVRTFEDIPRPELDLPDGWAWCRLGEVVHDHGQREPVARFTYIDVSSIDNARGRIGGDLKVLDADEAPSRARKLVAPGSVLYSTVRPYLLNVAVVESLPKPEPIVSTAFAVLHPIGGIEPWFLYHFLRSPPFVAYVSSQMKGVAYPAISDAQLYSGWVPIPPLPEQKRIVAKVDQLMGLIDELEAKQNKKREVQSRFRTSALDALTKAEGPEELTIAWKRVAGNFGAMFDGTESVAPLRAALLFLAVEGHLTLRGSRHEEILLGDVVESSFYGPRFSKEAYTGDGVPTVRTTDMDFGGNISLAGAPRVRLSEEEMAKYGLLDGDLLITRTGATIGKCAIYRPIAGPAIPSAYLIRFRLRRDLVLPDYVLLYLRSPIGQRLLGIRQTAMAQPNINAKAIAAFPFRLPPLGEQKRIVAKVEALMKLCDDLEAKLKAKEHTAGKLVEAVVKELVG